MHRQIEVLYKDALAGYVEPTGKGPRLGMMPGTYDVDFATQVQRPGDPTQGVAHFRKADTHTGGDLTVLKAEFEDLWDQKEGKGWRAVG